MITYVHMHIQQHIAHHTAGKFGDILIWRFANSQCLSDLIWCKPKNQSLLHMNVEQLAEAVLLKSA